MLAKEIRRRATELRHQATAAGVHFIITELETALLFLRVADTSRDNFRRRRAVLIACEAHDVALRSLERIAPGREEERTIDRLIRRVEHTLADHRI